MPIRTNRGRAAVYRRLWGWPLRSPRHLVGTLVVLAIVITAVGIAVPKLIGDDKDPSSPAAAQGTTSSANSAGGTHAPSASSQAPQSTRLTSPLASPTSSAPNPDALNVAKQWANAWANHPNGITAAQWLDGLRPYTTDEYLPKMSTVDPANIPATKVTGEPAVKVSFTSSVTAEIPTDGPKLSITVVRTDVGWRVSAFDEAG